MAKQPNIIQSTSQRLRSAEAVHAREHTNRTNERQRLVRGIKKSAILVVIFSLWIATICDILSIFDVGWMVSLLIPAASWFIVRRMKGMYTSTDEIVAAHKKARQEVALLRQRLRPALVATHNIRLLTGTTSADIHYIAKSYVATFVRDTAIVQLLELVPVLDWLPMYIGQVVKLLIDQNVAYQKAKALLPAYDITMRSLERLQRFEVEYLTNQLMSMIAQQQSSANGRWQPNNQQANTGAQQSPAPTNNTRPISRATSPPVQRPPTMRDIRPAVALPAAA